MAKPVLKGESHGKKFEVYRTRKEQIVRVFKPGSGELGVDWSMPKQLPPNVAADQGTLQTREGDYHPLPADATA